MGKIGGLKPCLSTWKSAQADSCSPKGFRELSRGFNPAETARKWHSRETDENYLELPTFQPPSRPHFPPGPGLSQPPYLLRPAREKEPIHPPFPNRKGTYSVMILLTFHSKRVLAPPPWGRRGWGKMSKLCQSKTSSQVNKLQKRSCNAPANYGVT